MVFEKSGKDATRAIGFTFNSGPLRSSAATDGKPGQGGQDVYTIDSVVDVWQPDLARAKSI